MTVDFIIPCVCCEHPPSIDDKTGYGMPKVGVCNSLLSHKPFWWVGNYKKIIGPKFMDYTEEFVEVPISGIYETGEDGTQITLSSGGNKLYVTYTLQP